MNSKDRLKHLTAFIQTAQYGSFTATAEALNMTPAALSKNVASLEQTFGVRLFNRTTRSLSLTEEGKFYLEQSKLALSILDEATARLQHQYQDEIAGNVRLSMPSLVGKYLILPLLGELFADYPDLHLELDLQNKVIDFVKDGYDFVLRIGEPSEQTLIVQQVAKLHSCLVATPDYLHTHGNPQSMADLAHHRCLHQRLPSGKLQAWQFKQADGLQPFIATAPPLILSDTDTMRNAVLSHLGIARLPVYLVWQDIREGRLRQVLPNQHYSEPLSLNLLYPHRTLLAPRVKFVMNYFREKLAQNDRLQGLP